jgi:hypothetical protein
MRMFFRSLLSACDSSQWDVVKKMLESTTRGIPPQKHVGKWSADCRAVGKQTKKLPQGMKVLQNTINLACEFDQVEFVKWMVEGTELHTDMEILGSILHNACRSGKLNVVQCIVNHTAIQQDMASLLIALDVACINSQLRVISWLMKYTELSSDVMLVKVPRNIS